MVQGIDCFVRTYSAWPCLFHPIPATCPLRARAHPHTHTHTEQHQQWLVVLCGHGPSKSCCHHSPGNQGAPPTVLTVASICYACRHLGTVLPHHCPERPPNTTWHFRCLSVCSGLTIRSSGKEVSCSASSFPFRPMNGLLLDTALFINILKTPCETRLTVRMLWQALLVYILCKIFLSIVIVCFFLNSISLVGSRAAHKEKKMYLLRIRSLLNLRDET